MVEDRAPESWVAARDRAVLRVRRRSLLQMQRLATFVELGVELPPAAEAGTIADRLVVDVVLDDPNLEPLRPDALAAWGVPLTEAVAVALTNTRSRIGVAFEAHRPGVFALRGRHAPSALLMPDLISHLPLRGAPIAITPVRDLLLVSGEDDPAMEALLREAHEKRHQNDANHHMSTPLVLRRRDWQVWKPAPPHPLAAAVREVTLFDDHATYQEQAEILEKVQERRETNIFVASLRISQERGKPRSFVLWPPVGRALLPEGERVVLGRNVGAEEIETVTATWEAVRAAAGDILARDPALDPPRWLARRALPRAAFDALVEVFGSKRMPRPPEPERA